MRFSNNELLEFLSGYVTLEEKDGYIFPKRFTPKQLKIAEERGFFPRPNSTSSMFFEFITDASEIKFDYVVFKGSSKEYFSIDVLEDGINTFNYHNDLAIEKGTMIIPLEKQGKRMKETVTKRTLEKWLAFRRKEDAAASKPGSYGLLFSKSVKKYKLYFL